MDNGFTGMRRSDHRRPGSVFLKGAAISLDRQLVDLWREYWWIRYGTTPPANERVIRISRNVWEQQGSVVNLDFVVVSRG